MFATNKTKQADSLVMGVSILDVSFRHMGTKTVMSR